LADNVETMLNLVGEHPFVQRSIYDAGKTPTFVLHTSEQLGDLKTLFKHEGPVILGIDRTFNLSSCFVTLITYKQISLLCNETHQPPFCFGPMFIHWDGSYETYHTFFSYIAGRLSGEVTGTELALPESLVLGSGEEKAMAKALDVCFPNSTRILCTKHLRENLKHYLSDKIDSRSFQQFEKTSRYFAYFELSLMLFGNNISRPILIRPTFIELNSLPNFVFNNWLPKLLNLVIRPGNPVGLIVLNIIIIILLDSAQFE